MLSSINTTSTEAIYDLVMCSYQTIPSLAVLIFPVRFTYYHSA